MGEEFGKARAKDKGSGVSPWHGLFQTPMYIDFSCGLLRSRRKTLVVSTVVIASRVAARQSTSKARSAIVCHSGRDPESSNKDREASKMLNYRSKCSATMKISLKYVHSLDIFHSIPLPPYDTALICSKNCFADADVLGGDLDPFVFVDPFEGVF